MARRWPGPYPERPRAGQKLRPPHLVVPPWHERAREGEPASRVRHCNAPAGGRAASRALADFFACAGPAVGQRVLAAQALEGVAGRASAPIATLAALEAQHPSLLAGCGRGRARGGSIWARLNPEVNLMVGEKVVVEKVPCPNCGKRLMPLPPNYPLYDLQCTGCLFRAQVKKSSLHRVAMI